MSRKTMVVIGATGVIGRRLIEHLEPLKDWEVVAVSRRAPDFATRAWHLPVDLSDPEDCAAKFAGLAEATHVVYAAYSDRPNWAEQRAPNAAMFRNALTALDKACPALRSVVLLQGTKYYGSHLGPFKTPAFEDDPRHMPPNFYFDQQDTMTALSRGRPWHWTALRPHTVCGFTFGMPMNLVPVIACYAVISKELGLPLRWPGKPAAYDKLFMVTDADLLSRSILWAAEAETAANEAFNVTNGDFFRWCHLFPRIADYFDMPCGDPAPIKLADFMADKEELWADICDRHGLDKQPLSRLVLWRFGDYIFNQDWDIMSHTTKIRQAGFGECIESGKMFMTWFDELRQRRIIPGA